MTSGASSLRTTYGGYPYCRYCGEPTSRNTVDNEPVQVEIRHPFDDSYAHRGCIPADHWIQNVETAECESCEFTAPKHYGLVLSLPSQDSGYQGLDPKYRESDGSDFVKASSFSDFYLCGSCLGESVERLETLAATLRGFGVLRSSLSFTEAFTPERMMGKVDCWPPMNDHGHPKFYTDISE